MIDEQTAAEADLDRIDAELSAEIDSAFASARDADPPDVGELTRDVFSGNGSELAAHGQVHATLPDGDTEDLGLVQAIHRTLDRAMATDDSIILLGEDIGDPSGGGMFKVTAGLSAKYGEDRVRDTPIAESSIIGAAIGASLGGLRPVAELMFMDFLGVAMDQIANHAAKVRYMSGGRTRRADGDPHDGRNGCRTAAFAGASKPGRCTHRASRWSGPAPPLTPPGC